MASVQLAESIFEMFTQSPARNDEAVQFAVKNMFLGAAPEREKELVQLWDQNQLRFNLLPDDGRDGQFVMDAGAYRDVRFNHRALRAFWVATFAAWEGYRACSESSTDLTSFASLLNCVSEIMNSDDPTMIPLPPGVPEPGSFVDAAINPQARAAAELAVFATGWALLHEVRHVQHQRSGSSAAHDSSTEDKHTEELSCDEFATKFILDCVPIYARDNNVSVLQVGQKRQAGVHFGLFALTIIGRDCWSGSDSHPSIQDRIDHAWRQMNSQDLNLIAALLSVGAFHSLKQIWPDAPCPPVLSVSIR